MATTERMGVDVLAVMDAYSDVPSTWGRIHDRDEIAKARAAVVELVEVATSIKARVEKGINAAGGRYKFMTPEAETQFDRLRAALAPFSEAGR